MTSDVTLLETAHAASFFLADGVILTGTHTGAAVDMTEFKVRMRDLGRNERQAERGKRDKQRQQKKTDKRDKQRPKKQAETGRDKRNEQRHVTSSSVSKLTETFT